MGHIDEMEVVDADVLTDGNGDEMRCHDEEGEAKKDDASEDSDENDDDDDDDDDEEDDAAAIEIAKVEKEIAAYPTNYQLHLQYIALLRKHGELEKLRIARKSMSVLFPLTPALWMQWTQDEIRLLTDSSSKQDICAVEELFSQAVQDYLSVDLWLAYIEFLEQYDAQISDMSEEGLAKIRAVFETALSACGLHFSEGGKVWTMYRDLEMAILNTMDSSDLEGVAKQSERVRSLFRRQLSIPLITLEDTQEKFLEWEAAQQGAEVEPTLPGPVETAYKKALSMVPPRTHFETKISEETGNAENVMKLYLSYGELEEASGDPARAQVLYERMVDLFPLHGHVWLKYMDFVDSHLKVPVVIRNVYSRAARNCPWIGQFWVRYLLALERMSASDEELSEVFEQSLLAGMVAPEEYLEVFLTRADSLRRKAMSSGASIEIESFFSRAVSHMETHFPDSADSILKLHSYWATMEWKANKNIQGARTVWENLVKARGWLVEAWRGYIAMEVWAGDVALARALYKRCYCRRLDGSGTEEICSSWLQFERQHGTLDDYDVALKKMKPRLSEVRSFEAQQAAAIEAPSEQVSKEAHVEPSSGKKRGLGFKEPAARKAKKSKQESAEDRSRPGEEQGEKQEEVHDRKAVIYKDECTAFVSSLPFSTNKEEVTQFFSDCKGLKEVRLVMARGTNRCKGIAYIDFEGEEGLQAALEKNKERIQGRPIVVQRSNPKQGSKGKPAPAQGSQSRFGGVHSSESESRKSQHQRLAHPPLTSSATFAVPRNVVRPGKVQLTATNRLPEKDAEKPLHSNDEFRKLMLKK